MLGRIKYLCDVKFGIVNICCIGTNLKESNGRPQYFGNLGLKLNLKGGGSNQVVDPSHLHCASQEDTMIMGYDVTHPSRNSSSRAPSIAAMTANIRPDRDQWAVALRIQESLQEMADIGDMAKDLLNSWKTVGKHASFPRNLLIFRDGVAESQYQMVKDRELPGLKGTCKQMYRVAGQEPPRITIVIVAKRHHTRFGPTTEATADSNGNCLAGTVTDRGITEAGHWDFWLRESALDSSF